MVCLYVIQKLVGPGLCREISSAREKNELRAARSAKNFSVMGLARKVLGLSVLGLKMVVSDQSNWS